MVVCSTIVVSAALAGGSGDLKVARGLPLLIALMPKGPPDALAGGTPELLC